MKRFSFFLRSYKFDLLTAIFAIFSYFLSFKLSSNEEAVLISSLIITLISVSLIMYLRLQEKDFFFLDLKRHTDRDDWIGRGNFVFNKSNKAFIISQSEAGFIFSKTLNWSDYSFEFEFKILQECLGVIVRAINLSDYVMLQIRDYGIRPHIRINGGWRPWEADETGLEFDEKLSKDKWYKCRCHCEKDLITISILEEKEVIFQRVWTIPHDRIAFPFPQRENEVNPSVIYFPINLDYGSVGFRDTQNEKALVKNMLIEKI